jgi:hypothetical protein
VGTAGWKLVGGKITTAVGGMFVGGIKVSWVAEIVPSGSGVGAPLVDGGVRLGSGVMVASSVSADCPASPLLDRLQALSRRVSSSVSGSIQRLNETCFRDIGNPLSMG